MEIGCEARLASRQTCGRTNFSCVVRETEVTHLQVSVGGQDHLPHITWCASGPLAFLPLHAAGVYGSKAEKLDMDTVSSYTPSISALLSTQRDAGELEPRVLVVAQPNTPHYDPLPGVIEEVNSI